MDIKRSGRKLSGGEFPVAKFWISTVSTVQFLFSGLPVYGLLFYVIFLSFLRAWKHFFFFFFFNRGINKTSEFWIYILKFKNTPFLGLSREIYPSQTTTNMCTRMRPSWGGGGWGAEHVHNLHVPRPEGYVTVHFRPVTCTVDILYFSWSRKFLPCGPSLHIRYSSVSMRFLLVHCPLHMRSMSGTPSVHPLHIR